jgi:hypothetical protein
MVTKTEVIRAPQEEVVIGAEEEIDPEVQSMMDALEAQVSEKIEAYNKRLASLEAATAVHPAGYQTWNCLLMGPFQNLGTPLNPNRPQKVIAGGRPAYMSAAVWVNQAPPSVGGFPASIILGGRDYNLRFETVDLTAVVRGPSRTYPKTFASPAVQLNWQTWEFTPPDPGPTPHIYEVNLTMDVTLSNQPFAGFATWHFDPDSELPFHIFPGQPAGWAFERPARFLVYHL